MIRYGQLICIYFFCFILSACYPTLPAKEFCSKKVKSDFRIVTYNLNWGGNRYSTTAPKKSIKLLKEINADLILLQEVTPFWFHALKANLSSLYPYMNFKPSAYAGGMAYISKYPVEQVQYLRPPVEGSWHFGVILDVKSPVGHLQVLNLHLSPPLISKKNPSFSIFPYFSSCHVREKEIQYFYNHMHKDKPIVIAGDFNEGDNSFVSYFLNQRGFRDAPKPNQYSWEWKLGCFKVKRKLDHVFYNSYFKLEEVQIIHDGDSDHFPIIVDLNVKHTTG